MKVGIELNGRTPDQLECMFSALPGGWSATEVDGGIVVTCPDGAEPTGEAVARRALAGTGLTGRVLFVVCPRPPVAPVVEAVVAAPVVEAVVAAAAPVAAAVKKEKKARKPAGKKP